MRVRLDGGRFARFTAQRLRSNSGAPSAASRVKEVEEYAPHSPSSAPAKATEKTHPSLKPFTQSPEDTAHSIPQLMWTELSANVQPQSVEPVAEKSKPASVEESSAKAAPSVQPPSSSIAPAPASITAAIASNVPAAPESTASTNPVSPDAPDPALVEAVVQRVLDKMRPQVVDIITKEFLRPVVQALVHREITKR